MYVLNSHQAFKAVYINAFSYLDNMKYDKNNTT